MPTRITAGRLMIPGSSASEPGAERRAGWCQPKASSRSELKYSAQPTDVAAPGDAVLQDQRTSRSRYAGSSPSGREGVCVGGPRDRDLVEATSA